jgi:hypothetical protein
MADTPTQIIPIPLGGWNKRDNPEEMQPTDAIIFENAISTAGHLEIRKGWQEFVRVSEEPIGTLFSYVNGENTYIGAITRDKDDGKVHIFTIDSKGVITKLPPPLDVDGTLTYPMKSDKFAVHYFKNRVYLSSENGEDKPIMFDGETLRVVAFKAKSPEIQEFSLYNVQSICSYQKRLFFIERNTNNIWYVYEAGTLYGTCATFDVSASSQKGGYLISLNEWSRAGNDNTQSLLVAINSEGECLVYSGTDPSSNWQFVSRTQMPLLISQRNTFSYKDDLALLTMGGIFTLKNTVGSVSVQRGQSISDKIIGAIKELNGVYDLDNWQLVYLMHLDWLLINIPEPDGTFTQFVCNFENETWSKFIGIPSLCWTSKNEDIFFGTADGRICKFGIGTTDGSNAISFKVQTAYSLLGVSTNKKVRELSIYVFSAFRRDFLIELYVDYVKQSLAKVKAIGAPIDVKICKWSDKLEPEDASYWDQDYWGSEIDMDSLRIQKLTTPMISNSGRRIGFTVSFNTKEKVESDVAWLSSDIRYEQSTY